MSYWPFWAGGLSLAGVMGLHWLGTGRMMAVSGRFSSLVNQLRTGKESPPPAFENEELMRLVAALTVEEFPGVPAPVPKAPKLENGPGDARPSAGSPLYHHALFFGAIAVGAYLARSFFGGTPFTFSLASESFGRLTDHSLLLSSLLLSAGGLLVGFGTRMAGGCTSGHGLCGVSRFQPGSLLATATFFGAGIATSFLLGAR